MTMFGRSDRTVFGRWFWTIDRPLLGMLLLLIGIGLLAVAAASPAAAARLSGTNFELGDLFFLKRQALWVVLGLPILIGVSMLPLSWAKRLSVLGTAILIVALAFLPFFGSERNGAIRWLMIGGFQLQPSEFLKPMLVVTSAWILSLRFEDDVPAIWVSGALVALAAVLLIMQPDVGQTVLVVSTWLAQAFIAGLSVTLLGVLAAITLLGLGIAYLFVPHVTSRIDRFLTGEGDNYQVLKALDAFRSGGMFGAGPGEGQTKFSLPEPHNDYIFAVIGEEFGVLFCAAVAILFLAIVARVLLQLLDEEDPFVTLAAAGLAAQFGMQAAINMSVAMNLLPSKGMTLPFISHGGSSFLAMSLGMGLLLSVTRRSQFRSRSPYAPKWSPA